MCTVLSTQSVFAQLHNEVASKASVYETEALVRKECLAERMPLRQEVNKMVQDEVQRVAAEQANDLVRVHSPITP
jgi:hypothetical protein